MQSMLMTSDPLHELLPRNQVTTRQSMYKLTQVVLLSLMPVPPSYTVYL